MLGNLNSSINYNENGLVFTLPLDNAKNETSKMYVFARNYLNILDRIY